MKIGTQAGSSLTDTVLGRLRDVCELVLLDAAYCCADLQNGRV